VKLINSVFVFVLFLSLFLLSFTVYKSNQQTIEHENLFSTDYKTVDRNYNKIIEQENIFKEQASFAYEYINDKLIIQINSKNDFKVQVLSIDALLTRPHTNKNNETLKVSLNKPYTIEIPKLSLGNWRVILKIAIKLKTKNIVLYKHINIKGK
jgi:nitrogen fixation protein FixH